MALATKVHVNGSAGAVRTAVRTAEIQLGGDYEGWAATMRVNPTAATWEDFSSGDDERFDRALSSIVLAWNFVDDDGKELPLPREGLDWKTAPFDLRLVLTNAYSAVVRDRMTVPKEVSTPSEPMLPNGTSG